MALGAILFWILGRIYGKRTRSLGYRLWVENQETLCAGAIAGGAIVGILIILIETTTS
jgi:hypothetical protein